MHKIAEVSVSNISLQVSERQRGGALAMLILNRHMQGEVLAGEL